VKKRKKIIEKTPLKKSPSGKVITSKKNDHFEKSSNEFLKDDMVIFKLTF